MDFKTAMTHYRSGTASEAERRLVEEELEKSQLIAEYLDAQWEEPAPAEAVQADMKRVRKSLRRRNCFIILTSLVLAAALLFATVQYAVPALEATYWNPDQQTFSGYTTDLLLTFSAYAELFAPDQTIISLNATHTGFAGYSLSLGQWHHRDQGRISYLTATLESGKLNLPDGFWELCSANIFERATFPDYYMDEYFHQSTRERLEELPGYLTVQAAVSFPEDFSMEALIAFEASLGEDGYIDWVGIRNSQGTQQVFPLCGMKPFSGGIHFEGINEHYPYFDIKGMENTPEILEAHFQALLQYSQDQLDKGTGIPFDINSRKSYYQQSLDYIAEYGVYSYGCYVEGPPQLFLELLDSGVVSQVWILDIQI